MGTKRKIPMAKRETKSQRSVTFSKRRLGLLKKAAELCVISGAQIAVLATSPSENLNAIYSGPFGRSCTDAVVDAFLAGRIPTAYDLFPGKTLGSAGFWSENLDFENCDDPDELRILIEKLSDLKNSVGMIQRKRKRQIVSWGSNLNKDNDLSVDTFPKDSTLETEEAENKKTQEVSKINVDSRSDGLDRDLDIYVQSGENEIAPLEHGHLDDNVFFDQMSLHAIGVLEDSADRLEMNEKAHEISGANNNGGSGKDDCLRFLKNSLIRGSGATTTIPIDVDYKNEKRD